MNPNVVQANVPDAGTSHPAATGETPHPALSVGAGRLVPANPDRAMNPNFVQVNVPDAGTSHPADIGGNSTPGLICTDDLKTPIRVQVVIRPFNMGRYSR